ncbi:MAG: deoxynucleoside kinase [Candidatus Tectomicrobia bacterium]|nr:deoxynucleoside kinase [Candidatus Tectomicrobia bacterium]
MEQARYIAIEGPIGVGKTSLAERLAEALRSPLLREVTEENPFLAHFYADTQRYAFQTQLFFLLSRYRQQLDLAQLDLFQRGVVSDYFFQKDRIFAYVNLDEDELALYEEIYSLLRPRVPRPDLVVFLQAGTDVLLERIRSRRRGFERNISSEYVERVNEAYNRFFFRYAETPLLVVNTDSIDFVQRRQDFEDLVQEILRVRQGTHLYVPRSS